MWLVSRGRCWHSGPCSSEVVVLDRAPLHGGGRGLIPPGGRHRVSPPCEDSGFGKSLWLGVRLRWFVDEFLVP